MARFGRFHLFVLIALCGCRPLGKTSVKPPSVDPSRAADQALELCDKDANGLLTASELAASPALSAALANYDSNKDKQLSREEIVTRLTEMYAHGTGLMGGSCRVMFSGRPLRQAHVRLVPEPFLGSEVKVAEGDTDGSGVAALSVAEADLPPKLHGLKLMQPGLYRVEVTHSSVKIPAKYNTQTTLGFELHPATPDDVVTLQLR